MCTYFDITCSIYSAICVYLIYSVYSIFFVANNSIHPFNSSQRPNNLTNDHLIFFPFLTERGSLWRRLNFQQWCQGASGNWAAACWNALWTWGLAMTPLEWAAATLIKATPPPLHPPHQVINTCHTCHVQQAPPSGRTPRLHITSQQSFHAGPTSLLLRRRSHGVGV